MHSCTKQIPDVGFPSGFCCGFPWRFPIAENPGVGRFLRRSLFFLGSVFWDTRLDFPWDLPVGLVSAV